MPKFQKIDILSRHTSNDYHYLINGDYEVIMKSIDYNKILAKKARLDFIARAKNTFYPDKFRIINFKNAVTTIIKKS